MNRNLPHVDLMIRRSLHRFMAGQDSVGSKELEQVAKQITFDLEGVSLVVDPEKLYGPVLRRAPGDGWTSAVAGPSPKLAEPVAEQPGRELKEPAAEWDRECACAASVAERLATGTRQRPEVLGVQAHYNLVILTIQVGDMPTYEAWLPYLGIAPESVQSRGYAVVGDGELEGVKVRLVAHGVPELQEEAAARTVSQAADAEVAELVAEGGEGQ